MGDFTFDKYVDGAQVVWDASSLNNFMLCPKKYEYENLLGLRGKERNPATYWGSAVHAGCEILDKAAHDGVDKEEGIRRALQHVMQEYGETLSASKDNARNLLTACRAIVWRADEYNYEMMQVASLPNGEAALEVRFECPFPGTDWRFSGRIDKLAVYNGDLYVVDTKTTKSSFNDRYWGYYEPDVQITAYTWATRHIIGLDVKGVIIEGISTGVNYTRFARRPFTVDDSQVEEWVNDARVFLEWADSCARTKYYPRNFNSCAAKGGCSFQHICSAPPRRREFWLERDFVQQLHATLEICADA